MDGYCRVLLVEDEFIMRQGIKYMMDWEKEGFCIVGEAANGREGLELVEKLQPHIVLADIVMPVMDGMEFSAVMGKRFPSVQLIILSGYDKFDYVKGTLLNGAADYMLKPAINPDILLKSLKKAVDRIPGFVLPKHKVVSFSRMLEKRLLGYHEEIPRENLKREFPHILFRLLAVNMKEMCKYSGAGLSEIQKEIEDFWGNQNGFFARHILVEKKILCTILNYKVIDEEKMFELAQMLADRMERFYKRAYFVMSSSFSDFEDIRDIYLQDVQTEVNQAFYSSKNLAARKGAQPVKELERFPFETYTMLLSRHRYEEALEMFSGYIDYVCDNHMEEHMMKNLTKNLLYNYLMEIEKYSVESEDMKEKYFGEIDAVAWIGDYRLMVERITDEIRGILFQVTGQDDLRIAEIKQYVAKHYTEPLELADIAKQFNFNYSYLSSYFSRSTREGFSEYLNKIRISHACELLKQGGLSISSIGENVGYSEHSYFCRVFKKITGETPSCYRRKNRKEV